MVMLTKFLTIQPTLTGTWGNFSNILQANLQALGPISIASFEVTRRESSRYGMGFGATVMYRQTTEFAGTTYSVISAEGSPAEAEASINTQLAVGQSRRARFVRTLYTGNQRTLNVGIVVVVDNLAEEPMERYSQSAAFILRAAQTIPANSSATVDVVNKNMDVIKQIIVYNPTPNPVTESEAPCLAFKDPSTGRWYHYPSCY